MLERAEVKFNPSVISVNDIVKEIKDRGFDASVREDDMAKASFKIGGMTCGGCVTYLTTQLKAMPGVVNADVALLLERADVTYDPVCWFAWSYAPLGQCCSPTTSQSVEPTHSGIRLITLCRNEMMQNDRA